MQVPSSLQLRVAHVFSTFSAGLPPAGQEAASGGGWPACHGQVHTPPPRPVAARPPSFCCRPRSFRRPFAVFSPPCRSPFAVLSPAPSGAFAVFHCLSRPFRRRSVAVSHLFCVPTIGACLSCPACHVLLEACCLSPVIGSIKHSLYSASTARITHRVACWPGR